MTADRATQTTLTTVKVAAIAAATILAALAATQLAFALGAPFEKYLWGGFIDESTRTLFRVASLSASAGLTWMAAVVISRANHDTTDRLQRAGLVAPGGTIQTFATINQAVADFQRR